MPAAGLADLVGDTFPAIIDGRAPSGPDEIVLGKRTLRGLHASIGKTVSVDLGEGAVEAERLQRFDQLVAVPGLFGQKLKDARS